jgi:putative SOS response-associated peptidase YedK
MCGRYTIYTKPDKLSEILKLENIIEYGSRYNAAPSQKLPLIIKNRAGMANWGILPRTSDTAPDNKPAAIINARYESIDKKPTFQESWERGRRCLIPANGFYEWALNNEQKIPYYIYPADKKLMTFAGLWTKQNGQVNFVIITKKACESIKHLHSRMPVILSENERNLWLEEESGACKNLLNSNKPTELNFHPVGKMVGNVSNDTADLLEPAKYKTYKQQSLF